MRAFGITALFILLAAVLAAQEPTFKSTPTRIVSIFATVLDPEGRIVPNLEKDDFTVLDNGKPQEIAVFDNSVRPFNVVVMLDQSASMTASLDLLKAAAEQFVLRMLPAIALIIPLYIMYKTLGLTNSYFGLVTVYTVVYIPFAVWLLVGFLRDFPLEIEEAALIDGCSRLRALVAVVVPIIAPGLAVVALFAFIATWNEFLFAVVLTGIETKTMMVLVTSFTSGGTDMFYGEASASVVLGVLPAFAVAFLLQRYLVKGLALGGTKG